MEDDNSKLWNIPNFSFKEEQTIRSMKWMLFNLEFNKKTFFEFFEEIINDILKKNKEVMFRKKAWYLIQHLWEEYMIFWFSHLNKIWEFPDRKTIMAVYFKLYHLLIYPILRYDNLSYIKGMLNRTEGSQAIENQILLKEIKSYLCEENKKVSEN